ncbi:MAG TPA: type IV toxin-antitoxin system AbiEi family antitoxin domain-containing protein [Solirubrobacterales bacterium]|nr:type IV toxin-antitoxin system AbiEi family antitoxin domain-containing protein [Solirubrobacterales bacterium]
MWDAQIAELAGRQFNRISRRQLFDLGLSEKAITYRVAAGRLVAVEQGVFAIAPVLEDDWGRWMAATLTAPGSVLSHTSAAVGWGLLSVPRWVECVTRPGSGGPRRHGGVLAFRSSTLDGDMTERRGIPITSVARTLLDLARTVGDRALARAVREAVRLEHTTLAALGDRLGEYRGRRGTRRLAGTIARYAGLPLERARSGAEVRAMEVLRDAKRPLPRLNARIAGEEADLSWPTVKLVIEIDGGPFHLDVGEDARKERTWERAGWTVRRIPSDDVYERPERLLRLSPPANVPGDPL